MLENNFLLFHYKMFNSKQLKVFYILWKITSLHSPITIGTRAMFFAIKKVFRSIVRQPFLKPLAKGTIIKRITTNKSIEKQSTRRLVGHIAHLRKTSNNKHICTWYHNVDLMLKNKKRRWKKQVILYLKIEWYFFVKCWKPLSKMPFYQGKLKFLKWFWRRRILKFS